MGGHLIREPDAGGKRGWVFGQDFDNKLDLKMSGAVSYFGG